MPISDHDRATARTSRPVAVFASQNVREMHGNRMLAIVALVIVGVTGCGPAQSDFMHPLAGDYVLGRTSAHQVAISPQSWTDDTPRIPSKVVEVGWDDRFILAKRQHLQRRGGSTTVGYEEPIEGKFDYWILDTQRPEVFGPFDEAEFGVKRKEFGVPDQIRLQNVDSLSTYRR